MRSTVISIVCMLLGFLNLCAQTPDGSSEVSKLKSDIVELQKSQATMIEQLNALARRMNGETDPHHGTVFAKTTPLEAETYQGTAKAKVVVVEYGDFECPFCRKFAREVYPKIVENYVKAGKIRYYFRDLPLAVHTHATLAAQAARCAEQRGKFTEMREGLFAIQSEISEQVLSNEAVAIGLDPVWFSKCLNNGKLGEQVRKSASDAQSIGISATPTLLIGLLDDGGKSLRIEKVIMGAYPYEVFQTDLDEILRSETRMALHERTILKSASEDDLN